MRKCDVCDHNFVMDDVAVMEVALAAQETLVVVIKVTPVGLVMVKSIFVVAVPLVMTLIVVRSCDDL